MKPENQKVYEDYMNEQLKILTGHFQRIMIRILNKAIKLEFDITGKDRLKLN